MGVFPIPFQYCLDEFEDLRSDTLFKCVSTGSIFINNLQTFMASESNANWWTDYVYAIGAQATCGTEEYDVTVVAEDDMMQAAQKSGKTFDRIVMSHVKVQTTIGAQVGGGRGGGRGRFFQH